MEKMISFVIMNVATSAILGVFCLIFLYFVISNITNKYYRYDFWEKFGMLFMFLLFVGSIWYCIQLAPVLNLSIDGACVVFILALVYLLISCKVTDNEFWDFL